MMGEQADEQTIAHAKARFGEMFASLGLDDPAEQATRFLIGVQQGMPPEESAKYYLGIEGDEFDQFMADPMVATLVRKLVGDIAKDQYRKVVTSEDARIAIEWLKANRSGVWKPRQDVTSGDQPIKAIVGVPIEDI